MEGRISGNITKCNMEIILEQMINSVCLIKNKKGNYEIALFVYLINKMKK